MADFQEFPKLMWNHATGDEITVSSAAEQAARSDVFSVTPPGTPAPSEAPEEPDETPEDEAEDESADEPDAVATPTRAARPRATRKPPIRHK